MAIVLLCFSLWDYSYNVSAVTLYDNNVFAYSSERIQEFMDNTAPYRYPFETYDDLRTGLSLSLRVRNTFFKNHTTTFNLGLDVYHHAVNKEKDFQDIEAGIRQSFGNFAVKTEYALIPEYLIRYYPDPAGSSREYLACEVRYQTLSGKITLLRLLPFPVHLTYTRRWEDYIEEFDLYDARAHCAGVEAEIHLTARVDIYPGYEFRVQESDAADALPAADEVPDGSFYQHDARVHMDVLCKMLFPGTLVIGYEYSFRNHRSDDVEDIIHFGRQDHVHTVMIERDARIFTGMEFVVSYLRRWRDATSEIYPPLSIIKDYDKYRLGAGLRFYF